MINHHPADDILVEYSAGSVSTYLAICISVHLLYCKQCRESVGRMQSLGGVLLETMPDEPLSNALFNGIMDRIEHYQAEKPEQINGPLCLLKTWLPDGLNGLSWRKQWLKLSEVVLETPQRGTWRLALQKIAAGGMAPLHGHHGREIIVVLQGGFSDESGVYEEGDFVIFDDNRRHRPQAFQNEDCICLTYLEAPVRLEGPVGKWIEKFRSLFGNQEAVIS
jgi:putative transcriptional regulator